MEARGLFLAKGDRRGFVALDHKETVYSLSRHGGIKTKELKSRLGRPDELPSVTMTGLKIRSTYNAEALAMIKNLKQKHRKEMLPLKEKKAVLVEIQRAERQELKDRHRVKRHITAKSARDGFRRGVMGLFDKVTGKESRLRLVGKGRLSKLKNQQSETRQKMIFRHNLERSKLQSPIEVMREKHSDDRRDFAKRLFKMRSTKKVQTRDSLTQKFESSSLDIKQEQSVEQGREQKRSRKQGQSREGGRSRSRSLSR